MKTPTIKQIAAHIGAQESLVRAIVRQIGGKESFENYAQDVTRHGASGGFAGFTYYTDTLAFYAKNQKVIVELCKNLADDIGEGNTLELVSRFNCLQGDSTQEEVGQTLYGTKRQHDTTVANALAWFALEEVCRAYWDLIEQE